MEVNVKFVTNSGSPDGMTRMEEYIKSIGKNLPRELSAVLNKTATKVKSSTKQPKGIKQDMQALYASGFLARDIAKLLHHQKSNKDTLRAVVFMNRKNRPSLTLFKHTFSKKNGVTYEMLKTKGTQRIQSAFNVKNLITKRVSKKAYPLRFLKGVSPAALFHGTKGLDTKTANHAKAILEKMSLERIDKLAAKEAKKNGVKK